MENFIKTLSTPQLELFQKISYQEMKSYFENATNKNTKKMEPVLNTDPVRFHGVHFDCCTENTEKIEPVENKQPQYDNIFSINPVVPSDSSTEKTEKMESVDNRKPDLFNGSVVFFE